MDSNDQFGFALDFDDKTQAWLDWVAPEHMQARIQQFLTSTVPEMPADTEWWKRPHSTRIMDAAIPLFGDWSAFITPGNRDLADGYIRFQGECYVRRAGYGWMNIPEWGPPLYTEFGPSVRYRDDQISDISMVSIAKHLFRDDSGPEIIEYSIAEAALRARGARTTD
ncbi:hypothetical protein HGA13_10685 [Nocardia speluncae]|uniref:Uncharacterized protein n=1 Tax=Nocardia speluncae TaxID=419477 RepID=A0A846XFR8_9NOCA|nr:hypothetical protein [Nocardia speluncae]NKY33536.1 hypothetical protein [Nocardia speluncae]